jgi:Tol biopolymer transport system component
MDMNKPWKEQTPVETPFINDNEAHFVAHSWSPDGKYLAGSGYEKKYLGIFTFSIEKRSYESISDFGVNPKWMRDNRRLLFVSEESVYLTDVHSKKAREILSFAPNKVSSLDISKDNRSIYACVTKTEADIWLLSLE